MRSFIDAAIGRSRTVLLTLALVLIGGTYAYVTVPKEAEPDVNIPVLYVNVHHEGISPEDAERLLVRPLEQELRGIEGLKELRSVAFQGGANVVLEFEAGFDVDRATTDVREKVDQAKVDLPEETDEPTVHEVNLSLFPVLVVSLSGDVPRRALLRLARQLEDELEALAPVLDVTIAGDREELVELVVDPLMLESYGIDARYVIQAIDRSNRLVAAGTQDTGRGRFAVKVPGLFEDAQDILDMPVKAAGDTTVKVRDVAALRRTFKDPEGYARIDGRPAIALEVSKRVGENIIETIEQVRARVERARAEWPAGVQVTYSQDKSATIRTMLADLQNNVLAAVLLVMIVVVGALGLRAAGLVGLAIPGSFLTGILVLWAAGLTVNIVVLFSLILAVGMLVDGAIVVTEYADRKLSEGLDKRAAYALAAKRMAWPIAAATATTLAAFLPLVFWPGVVGEFMKFLPVTLIATLTASLAMALVFVPTLGTVLGRQAGAADPEKARAIAAGTAGDLTRLTGFTGTYLRLLRRALAHPGKVLVAAVVLLVAVQVAYQHYGRGIEFFPDVEPDNALLQVRARGNLSVDERDRLLEEVERRILALHRERGEFHAVYARSQAAAAERREEPEDVIGLVQLEFTDWWMRRPAAEILADVRRRTADLAGIRVDLREQEAGPPVGKPIQLEVGAQRPELLAPAVHKIVAHMRTDGDYVDIEDGLPVPGIEWELEVDRAQAAKFGADVSLVGSYVRMVTNGLKVGEYRPDDADEEIDIVVRFPAERRTIDRLDALRLQTDEGTVPVANFVERRPRPKTGQLHRTDGRRVMTVKADLAAGVLADDKVRELRGFLASADLDPRLSLAFKGEDEEQQAARGFLVKAFVVALFLMAIILVTQFNSFYSAFLILSAVVLSTIGVMIGLLATGQPFGIVMSGIGIIALAGIVVNNNIVLIDTFDRLKASEPDTLHAVLRTGAQRLRPVLLTTATTMLGLLPMVLGVNVDFVGRAVQVGAPSMQWWQQLATAIVFGLGFATLLTLVITPCALMLRGDLAERRRARRGGRPEPEAPALPRAAE